MLSEADRHTLVISMETLLLDFEPEEACSYMKAKSVFSEDHVDSVQKMVSIPAFCPRKYCTASNNVVCGAVRSDTSSFSFVIVQILFT